MTESLDQRSVEATAEHHAFAQQHGLSARDDATGTGVVGSAQATSSGLSDWPLPPRPMQAADGESTRPAHGTAAPAPLTRPTLTPRLAPTVETLPQPPTPRGPPTAAPARPAALAATAHAEGRPGTAAAAPDPPPGTAVLAQNAGSGEPTTRADNALVERPTLVRRVQAATPPWCDPTGRSLELGAKPSKAAAAPWPPASAATYVPDTIVDACQVRGLELRLASTRGPSHRWAGALRQDDAGLAVTSDGLHALVVVADGVGRAGRSHEGARYAVQTALAFCRQALSSGRMDDLDADALVRTVDGVLLLHGPDVATTITIGVVAVHQHPETGERSGRVIRVGDSPAYVLRHHAFWPLFGDDKGAGVVHETATPSLPGCPGAVEQVEVNLASGDALVVATDGLGEPLRAEPVHEHLAECWQSPPSPADFLDQLQFRLRSYDDDRTAAVVWVTGDQS